MGWIEKYYVRRRRVLGKRRGCICIAPVGYLLQDIIAIRSEQTDPADPRAANYVVKALKPYAIGKGSPDSPFHRFPDTNLKLAIDEEHLAIKHKLRPVVVLSPAFDPWFRSLVMLGGEKRFQECFLCVPMYSVRNKDGTSRFKAGFVKGLRLFQWPCLFHLPENVSFSQRESFLRFDRVQAIHRDNLGRTPTMLSDDALTVVLEAFYSFIADKDTDLIADYKEELAKVAQAADQGQCT